MFNSTFLLSAMDVLQLGLTDEDYRRHVEAEFEKTTLSKKSELVRLACCGNVRQRLRALAHLPPADQFRLHLMYAGLANDGTRVQQLSKLGQSGDHKDSLADYFSRVAGYVPLEQSQSALAVLPVRRDSAVLEDDLHLLIDRTMERPGSAGNPKAETIAQRLLDIRTDEGVQRDPAYHRPLPLARAVFNVHLMQALRKAGHSLRSMTSFLNPGRDTDSDFNICSLTARKIMNPWQSSRQYEIDTVNNCLTTLPPSVGERLAVRYWETYKNTKTATSVVRLAQVPDAVRAEAMQGGTVRYHRASVEMIMRSIGVQNPQDMNDGHLEEFGRFLGNLGLSDRINDVMPLWKKLKECRDQFRSVLYVSEALERKAT